MKIKNLAKLASLLFILLALPIFAIAESLPDMEVALLSYDPTPVQAGQTINLYLEVSNKGTVTKNAWLEIVEDGPFRIEQTQDVLRAQLLGSLSSPQKLQFRIKIDETAKDGLAPLTVKFGTSEDKSNYQEQQFDINIQTFDSSLTIQNIKQIPDELVPGEKGILRLTLTNFDDRPVQNLDIVLDMTNSYDMNRNMNNMLSVQAMINARLEDVNRRIASGQSPLKGATPMMSGTDKEGKRMPLEFHAIAPVDGSTHKRIKEMGAGEKITLEFEIQALPSAHANIYALPVYINYDDENNNPFHTATEIPSSI